MAADDETDVSGKINEQSEETPEENPEERPDNQDTPIEQIGKNE